jgi:hypothetical protein
MLSLHYEPFSAIYSVRPGEDPLLDNPKRQERYLDTIGPGAQPRSRQFKKPFSDALLTPVGRVEIAEGRVVLTVDQMNFCAFCRLSCFPSKEILSRMEPCDHLSVINDRSENFLEKTSRPVSIVAPISLTPARVLLYRGRQHPRAELDPQGQ